MKNDLLIQPVMRPLMSPKKMAPFGSNMHYKTNFRIGIPGMPFDPKFDSYPVPQPETDKVYKLSNNTEFPNAPSNAQLSQKIITPPKQIYSNQSEPDFVERKVHHQVVSDTKRSENKEVRSENKEVFTEDRIPVEKHNEKTYEEPFQKNDRNSVYSKGSSQEPNSDFNTIVSPMKDAIGLFLPSQYEDQVLKNKEKNQKFQKELAILQSRKCQDKLVILSSGRGEEGEETER